ncbi:Metallo-dependent phosphatase-like protein [Spinellus fusiger]|nr:Metallo-dependent phosphatase-like protein [Spinellus fusiger]
MSISSHLFILGSLLVLLIYTTQPPSLLLLRGASMGPIAYHSPDLAWNTHLLVKTVPKKHGYFLHITDMHVDDDYTPGATIKSACHKIKSSGSSHVAGPLGTPGEKCDSPPQLAQATLDWIAREWRDKLDFVVWTGDNARHGWDNSIKRKRKDVYSTNQKVTDMIQRTFGSSHSATSLPVIPCLGNNDVFPHNSIHEGAKEKDLLSFYEHLWSQWIPVDQRSSFRQGAYFVTTVSPHLQVVSLNTLYFFNRNPAVMNCNKGSPGDKQLFWLEKQLTQAQLQGTKVYIMGHVPPSSRDFYGSCLKKYISTVSKYTDNVMGQFFGHLNMDHFMLYSEQMKVQDMPFLPDLQEDHDVHTTRDIGAYVTWLRDMYVSLESVSDPGQTSSPSSPLLVVQVSPSVLPVYWPAVRIYRYDTGEGADYGTLLGYSQYHANESAYHAASSGPLEYSLEYTTEELYGLKDLSAKSYFQMAKQMVQGTEEGNRTWKAYLQNMFVQAHNSKFNG